MSQVQYSMRESRVAGPERYEIADLISHVKTGQDILSYMAMGGRVRGGDE